MANKSKSYDKKISKMKVGEYQLLIQEKGVNEMCAEKKIKEGTPFWVVRLDKESWFDTLSQSKAIELSLLVQLKLQVKSLRKDLSGVISQY